MLQPKGVANRGNIVRREFFSVVEAVEQGQLGMETLAKRGKKRGAQFAVRYATGKRHQDAVGMRLTHMHDPHDGEVGPDGAEQQMDGVRLHGGPVLLVWQEGVKDQIGPFRQDTFGQQARDVAEFIDGGDGDAMIDGNGKEVVYVVLGAAKDLLAGSLGMGSIQYQTRLGGCGQGDCIAGGYRRAAMFGDYGDNSPVAHVVSGAAGLSNTQNRAALLLCME